MASRANDRRQFLQLGLGALALGGMRVLHATPDLAYLDYRTDWDGRHWLSLLNARGRPIGDIQLADRGHGMAVDPVHNRAAVFARRPGTFVWIVELGEQQLIHKINAIPERHYYGHGEFSADGNSLYCSENDYASGTGYVSVYDARRGFSRSGEIPSHGIGPHEIRLLADGRTLVIANGGIRPHPDTLRIKHNLGEMRPNLAYVDTLSGKLLHRHEPPRHWHQLSIRHINRTADDRIAIAMQFEGGPQLQPPLVALQQGDAELQLLSAPQQIAAVRQRAAGAVYEDPLHCTNVSVDDVQVKKQKAHREYAGAAAEPGGLAAVAPSSTPLGAASEAGNPSRPKVANTVARIEQGTRRFTLSAPSLGQVLRFVLAFLLHNDLLGGGRLHQWADGYDLYHRPADRFVADFIGQGSMVSGKGRWANTVSKRHWAS